MGIQGSIGQFVNLYWLGTYFPGWDYCMKDNSNQVVQTGRNYIHI